MIITIPVLFTIHLDLHLHLHSSSSIEFDSLILPLSMLTQSSVAFAWLPCGLIITTLN